MNLLSFEESILNINIVNQIMWSEYGINVIRTERIERGSANIYKLYSQEKQYILKEVQSEITYERIEREYMILMHLSANGIKTPQYLLTKNGCIAFKYRGKYIIVQHYIDGHYVEANTATRGQILDSAQLYIQILKALESYNGELPVFTKHFMSDKIGEENIKDILFLIDKSNEKNIREALVHKMHIIQKYCQFDYGWQNKLTVKKSHGDYSVYQFIYDSNGKTMAVLDFLSAKKTPIARELIRNYFFMAKEVELGCIDFDFFIEYISDFIVYYPLNYYDLKYMPLMYFLELAKTTYSFSHYMENGSKEYLAFANKLYNYCICLEENGKMLSCRLLQLL